MPILRIVLGAVVAGDPKQSWVEVDFVWKAVLRGLGHFLFLLNLAYIVYHATKQPSRGTCDNLA